MRIDPIKNGIVIDHIEAGKGMTVYNFLNLGDLNCTVALIKNVPSKKTGKKDIIKIDADVVIDFKVLGYIAPEVTVNIIKDGNSVEKKKLELPQEVKNVIKCKNPRCITSVEQGIDQVFKLVDKENRTYRCIYCESKAQN
jgi:aspartate carbamoyltransferase regulatory subunit